MKEVKKKGVSPVIATVLLIALVIVIALIIFLFMRNIGEETLTKFGKENIKLACQKVEFDASYSGGILAISNFGGTPIFDMSIKIVKQGSHETIKFQGNEYYKEVWPSSGLSQGGVVSLDFSSLISPDVEKIVITPILVGETREGARKTYTCQEGPYNQEIII
jgi:flagellin-like protein